MSRETNDQELAEALEVIENELEREHRAAVNSDAITFGETSRLLA